VIFFINLSFNFPFVSRPLCNIHLARSAAWNVLATSRGFTPCNGDTGPSPAGAGAGAAENVNVGC
jgi:hypothetical protein